MANTVGRKRELSEARACLRAEVPGSVLFRGPAGIGKSTLLDAAVADSTGFQVRRARAAAAETDLPFVGLHDLVGTDIDDVVSTLSAPLREALQVVLLRTEPGDSGTDALAVNLAVFETFQIMAERQRLLLVLDDLQWLDQPTRRVLDFALRRLPADRFAVLAAARDGFDPARSPLSEPLTLVEVEPLTEGEIADVVALLLGHPPSPGRAATLHQMSGGNPFLALELARSAAVVPAGVTELPVPERYRPVLAERMSGLSPEGMRTILAAALLSRPTTGVLGRVGRADGVTEAEGAGILRHSDGAVEFVHPLMAAACREEAGSAKVRLMHGELGALGDEGSERARHRALAASDPDELLAAELEAAAHDAANRAAPSTAGELAAHAVRLTTADALEDRVRRAVEAAEWFGEAGEPAKARDLLGSVLKAAPGGSLRARCLVALADSQGQEIAGSLELYRQAVAQPALEPDVKLKARMKIAECLLITGCLEGARRELDVAIDQIPSQGPTDLVASADLLLAEIEYSTGTPLAASAAWARACRHDWDSPPVYDHPERLEALEASHGDDQATAAGLLDELVQRSRRLHDLTSEGQLQLHRAEVEIRRGRLDAAAKCAEACYRKCADGVRDQVPLYVRAHAAAWRGRLSEARKLAGEGLRMARDARDSIFEAQCLLTLGFTELSAGNYEAACGHESELKDMAARTVYGHPGAFRWHADAVESFVAFGQVDEARAVSVALWRDADRLNLPGCKALAARCDGLIHAQAGDFKLAEDSLLQSLSLMDGLEMPLERARSLLALGVVRRRARQKATARDVLGEARDIFAASGAAVWAQRAEDELTRTAGAHAGQDLTTGEASVAELAAGGATNREIAGQLFLSPKTVETTLTRIYRKLGVRSRTELARHPAVWTGAGKGEGEGIP